MHVSAIRSGWFRWVFRSMGPAPSHDSRVNHTHIGDYDEVSHKPTGSGRPIDRVTWIVNNTSSEIDRGTTSCTNCGPDVEICPVCC